MSSTRSSKNSNPVSQVKVPYSSTSEQYAANKYICHVFKVEKIDAVASVTVAVNPVSVTGAGTFSVALFYGAEDLTVSASNPDGGAAPTVTQLQSMVLIKEVSLTSGTFAQIVEFATLSYMCVAIFSTHAGSSTGITLALETYLFTEALAQATETVNIGSGAIHVSTTGSDTVATVVNSSALPTNAATETGVAAVTAAVNARPTYSTIGSGAMADRLLVDVVELAQAGPTVSTSLPRVGVFGQITGTSSWKPPLLSTDGHLLVKRSVGPLPSSSTIFGGTSVSAGSTAASFSIDTAYNTTVSVFGTVSQNSNLTLSVQLSTNDSTWFTDPDTIYIGFSGDFSRTFQTGVRYIRLQLINSGTTTTTITAVASYKNEAVLT